VTFVERHELFDVHVSDAVAVGETERWVAIDELADVLQAAAGLRLLAGVHERHPPRLGVAMMDLHFVVGDVERDIGGVEEIIGEVFLDDVALVAQTDHEIVDAVGAVELHDVPEDRLAADLDHGLGFYRGFLGNPRAHTTGKNHGLHGRSHTTIYRRRR